ncbi:putative GTP-binding protein 6 isoform X1 [Tachyglossus aculeatus]|uniref:putative GTP-binding protein 6 isoform X1 n=1 Tax=Tachyglossus aculeatus TaxID=9261 RepID=UPI0018F584E9|nr:putative GTP-binding protein 6 isoform X1 [Tachyglossus aculeatus]
MWASRAVGGRGATLLCSRLRCSPPVLAPLPRVLDARTHRIRTQTRGLSGGRRRAGAAGTRRGGRDYGVDDDHGDEEEEPLLRAEPLLPLGSQRVFLVHPDIKWGPKKPTLTRVDLQVAEATALVRTLAGWSVEETAVVSTKTPDKKLLFGKGNFALLTEKIKGCPQITSVFLNVERITPLTKKELESAWGVEVFDRFTIVLHIFRCNARTREAKLQLALAEIPLLRANLRNEVAHLDQQGGGSRYILGSGETHLEVQQRLLKEKEGKIQKALEKLKRKRHLLRNQREKCEFPTVAVMGYTNSGKTSLIRALTGDPAAEPRDRPFATLDVTAHAGALPSRLTVVYVDTIGFLSRLPHGLIESFSATLEDAAHADLIIHVRDISHLDTALQKASVLAVLRNLRLPRELLDSIVEVHNKVDLMDRYTPSEPNAVAVSALRGHGLEELKAEIDRMVLKATGRKVLTLKIDLAGAQLSWLYKEATVQEVDVIPEDGTANVRVIISPSAYGKYRNRFPG